MDGLILFGLGWQGWSTLLIVLMMIAALVRDWARPDVVLGATLGTLLLTGVLRPSAALAGFGNEGLITVAALFIVAQAVTETGVLAPLAAFLWRKPRGVGWAVAWMMIPVATVSSVLNNTPVVAIFLPLVRSFAARYDISPSKLLIPLSYAAILGGMCTLIGTSTNLVVNGLMISHGYESMSLFELSPVGLPIALLGILIVAVVGVRLLPDRRDVTAQLRETQREYLVELTVQPGCPLVGKTVEGGGLRHLKGLFLVHIERGGHVLGPVPPNEVIALGDHLVFTGAVSTIIDLKTIRGLEPVGTTDIGLWATGKLGELRLFEVVVSPSSPLVGMGVRAAEFRNRYDAAVIAVHRVGQRVAGKIGDIVLRSGDTLLLEADEAFARRWSSSIHFYLVSEVADAQRVRHEKAPLVLGVLVAMVALPAFDILPMAVSAIAAAALLVLVKALSPASAKSSIDLSVIVVIACALGVGQALQSSGLASKAAELLLGSSRDTSPFVVLVLFMLATSVLTEIMSNAATAALLFPLAVEAATTAGFEARPLFIGIAISASCSFATPLGYQTNLMVYGPGGYKFTDFLRIGLVMNLLALVVGSLAIGLVYGIL
ncbi:MAG: SLC13 family permease [Myxococcota bacterium]|jgi:di/tricarboxylate transporter|nr:SLC13 family permease [Myxococcota bacterium]